ncbi:MAG: COX15/CtaA family protein [Caldilineaceae bacterium]|nr:COX15/CtaA family protein [Caldilineaceae bacterium]
MSDAVHNPHAPFSPWPHRVAVLLVCVVFPLIWLGGLVTSSDAGMAVPDWPGTYGYNLFLYPWQTWLAAPYDIFIEHGHRLLGSAAGMISIALVAVVWFCDRRPAARALAAAVLGAVVLQGLLGGLRVMNNSLQIARLHGIVGPAFFALCVSMAVVTSKLWRDGRTQKPQVGAGRLHRLAFITAGLVFLQLVLGANLRHTPHNVEPGSLRIFVFFHLLVAAALLVHALLLALRVLRVHGGLRPLVRPTLGLAMCLVAQIGLGCAAWVVNYSWPVWAQSMGLPAGYVVQAGSLSQSLTVTAHQAMGSLILALSVVVSLRSWRLVPAAQQDAAEDVARFAGVLA